MSDLQGVLDALHYRPGEYVAICRQAPGGTFVAEVVEAQDAAALVAALGPTLNVWFGVNPVAGPVRRGAGRGRAEDVTRLAGLYGDLDVKPTGLADFTTASAVIDVISDMLGTPPTVVILSGHGMQPIWPLEEGEGEATEPTARAALATLLRRFGRLLASVAERHGGGVDSVFDLSRVLRAPGSYNLKADPVPVVAWFPGGAPLTVAQIEDVLTTYDVKTYDEDLIDPGEVISPPADWGHAEETCAYVRAMVTAWRTATPPQRHPWLVAQAVRLAAAHRGGCLTEAEHLAARGRLVERFEWLCAHSEPTRAVNPGEVAGAVSWGIALVAAMTDDRARSELGSHPHPEPLDRPVQTVEVAEGPRTYSRTDDGNGLRLVDLYGATIRYAPERGRWLSWDGRRWRWDEPAVRQLARGLARELPTGTGLEARFRDRSLSVPRVQAAVDSAADDRRVHVHLADLDARPYEINTPGGPVDLATGRLLAPDPAAMHTRQTAVAPSFEPPVRWLEFLATTFAGDPAVGDYVQRLLGLTVIGAVLEQILAFCYGPGGSNGKSTLLNTTARILGNGEDGYAGSAPTSLVMATTYAEHPTVIARLAGRRMVVVSELEADQRMAEARVKLLTGADQLAGRFMREDWVTFRPTHTIWMQANEAPVVRVGGDALWRRIRLVPFLHRVPAEAREAALEDRLVGEEGPAILGWILAGAAAYLAAGNLADPEAVLAATAAYAAEEDTVGRFVGERCVVGEAGVIGMLVPVARLRAEYVAWCRDDGSSPVSARSLTQALRTRHGVIPDRTADYRLYRGIRLHLQANDDVGIWG